MNANVISFGCLNTQLAKDQTKVVLDRLQEVSPRLAGRLEIVASPVLPEQLAASSFLVADAAEVEFIQTQLLSGAFRLAVLCAQDLTLPLCDGVRIVAVPPRDTPFDAFLTRQSLIIDDMPEGSVIGVLNLRSRTQMQALWPGLVFRQLRGGMQSALEALLRRCELDGLVAPAAVVEHLGLQGIVAEIFNPELILPSGGQGILAVLGRADDSEIAALLAPLHSEPTERELAAEFAFLQRFARDLELPVGVLARCTDDGLTVSSAVGSDAGALASLQQREGPAEQAAVLGIELAEAILAHDDALIGLLEADFPEGLPADDDEQDQDQDQDPDLAVLKEYLELDGEPPNQND
ncbi:MAG: hypothetical protein RBT60_03845 [Candidatus Krumholzibacteria bacterium]|nr:hypothetical protein [Candidatus Krumholzibacteria bacterium]